MSTAMPALHRLTLALLLALPLAATGSDTPAPERESRVAPSAREAERAARAAERDAARAHAAIEREAEQAARLAARDAERAHATTAREAEQATRAAEAELRSAERELRVAAARVAELSQQAARADMERAMSRSAFSRPVVGVILQADRQTGVRLAGVTPNGPSAKAGLRSGDRIVAIDDQPVRDGSPEQRLERARELLADLEDGQRVTLDYERDGRVARVDVEADSLPGLVWMGKSLPALAARPEALLPLEALSPTPFEFNMIAPEALLDCSAGGEQGCDLGPLADALRWRGLRLARVEKQLGRYFGTDHGVLVLSSDAQLGDLQPGDVLLSVDGEEVRGPGEVMRAMRRADPGEQIAVSVLRDRKRLVVDLDAPRLARLPLFAPPAPPAPPTPPAQPAPPTPGALPAPPAPPPAPPAPAAVPEPPTPHARLLGWHGARPLVTPPVPATPAPGRRGVLAQTLDGRVVD